MPITHFNSVVIGNMNAKTGLTTGAGSITLLAQDLKDCNILQFTTGHASNTCIIPVLPAFKPYIIQGAAGAAVLVKRASQATPVTVAATKTAIVMSNGTDIVRVTPDA